MTNTVTIRKAGADDAGIILGLIRELAEFEKLSHEVVGTQEQLAAHLAGGKAHALIADVDGAVAAFALYFYNYSTFLTRPGLYLEDLYVRPEYRSHGLGKTLLKELAAIAVEEGCGRFEWWVLNWNEPAINFYKKIGARAMDEWTVFRVDGDQLPALAQADTKATKAA